MTSFYRGKRVSEYRKQSHNMSGGLPETGSVKFELSTGPTDRIRAIKNFRCLVTIWGNDSSAYNNYAGGMLCMYRCATGDYPQGGVLNVEASALLHPVPFAQGGGPLTIAYEFRGITVGQLEEAWFVVQGRNGTGVNNALISALWAQKDTLTP